MLSEHDSVLVRRDPLIPGLATILDPEAFAEMLTRQLDGIEIRDAVSRYARYKPGASCLAAWELDLGTTTLNVHAKAYAPAQSETFRGAAGGSVTLTPYGPARLVLPELTTIISIFPHDCRLPGVAKLDDRVVRWSLMPHRPQLQQAALEMLDYKPEYRYVARCMGPGGRGAVVRVYPRHEFTNAERALEQLDSGDAYRVAERIGVSRSERALAVEWLAGTSLSTLFAEGPVQVAALAVTTAALAELHGRRAKGLTAITPTQEAADLLHLKSDLQYIAPGMSSRLEETGRRLASRLSGLSARRDLIHGDFHAGQVIIGRVAQFVDLDNARLGDPTTDLGNFLAHLEAAAIDGSLDGKTAEGVAGAFLALYDGVSPWMARKERLRIRTAASLFRLLPRPFRTRRTHWQTTMHQMLERVEELLGESSPRHMRHRSQPRTIATKRDAALVRA